MSIKISNKKGLTLHVTSNNREDMIVSLGGMDSNPTWDEYIKIWKSKYRPHLCLIRDVIIANNWVGETGEFQNGFCFEFSDGIALGFTWRAWGDLMQAIVNKREGYMKYYM